MCVCVCNIWFSNVYFCTCHRHKLFWHEYHSSMLLNMLCRSTYFVWNICRHKQEVRCPNPYWLLDSNTRRGILLLAAIFDYKCIHLSHNNLLQIVSNSTIQKPLHSEYRYFCQSFFYGPTNKGETVLNLQHLKWFWKLWAEFLFPQSGRCL